MKKQNLLIMAMSIFALMSCSNTPSSTESLTTSSEEQSTLSNQTTTSEQSTTSSQTTLEENQYEGYEHYTSFPNEQIKEFFATTEDLPSYQANDYYYLADIDYDYGLFVEIIIPNQDDSSLTTYATTLENANYTLDPNSLADLFLYYNDVYDVYIMYDNGELIIDIFLEESLAYEEDYFTSWEEVMNKVNTYLQTSGEIPAPNASEFYGISDETYGYKQYILCFETTETDFCETYKSTLETLNWEVYSETDEDGLYYEAIDENMIYDIIFYEFDGLIYFQIAAIADLF